MKPRIIRSGLVCLYLIVVFAFMEWKLSILFDVKIFFLLFAGISMYVLAYHNKNDSLENTLKSVQEAVCPVGISSTFLLLFYQFYETGISRFSFTDFALNLRPGFYSAILFFILNAKEKDFVPNNEQTNHVKNAAQELYFWLKENGLTQRETEISIHILKGLSNTEIAEELFITEATVKKHITHIYEKLCVPGRKEFIERCKSPLP